MPEQNQNTNITQKIISGSFWSFFYFYGLKIFNITYTIIIARLLLPVDFGLASLVGISTSVLAVFSETGIDRFLIQKKEINDDLINTAWTINIVRGALLFVSVFFLSPFLAKFFNNNNLSLLLKIASFTLILNGFNSMSLILLQKELLFKTRAIYNFFCELFRIIITLLFAFFLRNVWALILGLLLSSLFNLCYSFLIHPYRPKLIFNSKIFKEIFDFGKYIFLSEIIIFFLYQGDDALVGKILGASALGFYTMAYGISNKPTSDISGIIGEVSFPAYSKVKDDLTSLRTYYHKTLKLTSTITIFYGTILLLFSYEIIQFVFGYKWLPMLNTLRILCFYGIFRSLFTSSGSLFFSNNKPEILLKINVITLILMILFIYPLTIKYGTAGTALATTLTIFVKTILCFYYSSILLKEKLFFHFKDLVYSFSISFLLCIIFWYLKNSFLYLSLIQVIFLISLFSVIYFILLFFLDKDLVANFKLILQGILLEKKTK